MHTLFNIISVIGSLAFYLGSQLFDVCFVILRKLVVKTSCETIFAFVRFSKFSLSLNVFLNVKNLFQSNVIRLKCFKKRDFSFSISTFGLSAEGDVTQRFILTSIPFCGICTLVSDPPADVQRHAGRRLDIRPRFREFSFSDCDLEAQIIHLWCLLLEQEKKETTIKY